MSRVRISADQNLNGAYFDGRYGRRLGMPVKLNFDVQATLAMFRRLMEPLQTVPSGFSVLDIRVGYGHMLLTFPPHCRLAGVEVSASPVRRMTSEAAARGYQGSSFKQLDINATDLPWPDGSVDLVVCSLGVLMPPVWNLPPSGPPRDYGLLARKPNDAERRRG